MRSRSSRMCVCLSAESVGWEDSGGEVGVVGARRPEGPMVDVVLVDKVPFKRSAVADEGEVDGEGRVVEGGRSIVVVDGGDDGGEFVVVLALLESPVEVRILDGFVERPALGRGGFLGQFLEREEPGVVEGQGEGEGVGVARGEAEERGLDHISAGGDGAGASDLAEGVGGGAEAGGKARVGAGDGDPRGLEVRGDDLGTVGRRRDRELELAPLVRDRDDHAGGDSVEKVAQRRGAHYELGERRNQARGLVPHDDLPARDSTRRDDSPIASSFAATAATTASCEASIETTTRRRLAQVDSGARNAAVAATTPIHAAARRIRIAAT
eukprot:CAMPEP_0197389304 /NCGR_PEP_ID=MMETSP1165-20131217/1613_1 /TAXON_ID=284809 /ORGANISM="Chrysocystis fragilis, Strain CCMP3189" /LENGTH=324 /DNA_ID=CAMNT_0042914707 /DNA_START=427 /DNA_END=1398 /DNA_ORIENTATION=+